VTLNSHALSLVTAANNLTLSGGITGAGNLTLNANGAGVITVSGLAEQHRNDHQFRHGRGHQRDQRPHRRHVTGLVQNSATSVLNLTNNANQFTGTTSILAAAEARRPIRALEEPLRHHRLERDHHRARLGHSHRAVLGGLAGSVNLASAVTAGYSAVTALTLNPQTGTSVTYSGVITNGLPAGMALTKTGYGTQTLTGVNTYSGATNVYAGTLALSGASGSALNSAVTVRGGTLLLDNSAAWVDRVSDSAALSLGSLTLTSSNGASAQTETVGATTFAVGGKSPSTTAPPRRPDHAGAGRSDPLGRRGHRLRRHGRHARRRANSPNVTCFAFPGASNGILPWATVGGTAWAEDNIGSIRATPARSTPT